jgi:hypothetical protein
MGRPTGCFEIDIDDTCHIKEGGLSDEGKGRSLRICLPSAASFHGLREPVLNPSPSPGLRTCLLGLFNVGPATTIQRSHNEWADDSHDQKQVNC